jgi:hypothetical protein
MLSDLADAVENLDIPLERDALAAVYQLSDRLHAKLTAAIGAYDAAGGCEIDGCVNLAQWLRHWVDRSRGDAARDAKAAKVLRHVPVTSARYADGTLSAGQVAAIVANLSERTLDAFAEHEAELVPRLAALSAADTATVMRQWAICAEAVADVDEPAEPERSLHVWETLAGRRELSGHLDPDSGMVVETALREAATGDVEGGPTRTPAERRADALVDVCRWFLDHRHQPPAGRHRPHVNLAIGLDDLVAGRPGATADGDPVDAAAASRYACDSVLHRMLVARGAILDYGTATRTVPGPLWNALVLRDAHCRIGSCDRPATWCEAHHIQWVEHGGPTRLDNLILVCSRHHHLVHQNRWEVKLDCDGVVEVTLTDGTLLVSRPPPRPWDAPDSG